MNEQKEKAPVEEQSAPEESCLADVAIKTSGTTAKIFLNGKRIHNVIGYKIEHDAQDKAMPVLTLQIQCRLDVETQTMPILPEPWSWFYKPKYDDITFVDPREKQDKMLAFNGYDKEVNWP